MPIGLNTPGAFAAIAAIAQRHPALKLSIGHLGMQRADLYLTGHAAFSYVADLAALARYPNLAVAASGTPSGSGERYPFRNISDHLRRVFDAFGPQRMFWGSDLTRQPCSYRQCVTHFAEELPWLHGADLALVMGGALCAWTGWKPQDS